MSFQDLWLNSTTKDLTHAASLPPEEFLHPQTLYYVYAADLQHWICDAAVWASWSGLERCVARAVNVWQQTNDQALSNPIVKLQVSRLMECMTTSLQLDPLAREQSVDYQDAVLFLLLVGADGSERDGPLWPWFFGTLKTVWPVGVGRWDDWTYVERVSDGWTWMNQEKRQSFHTIWQEVVGGEGSEGSKSRTLSREETGNASDNPSGSVSGTMSSKTLSGGEEMAMK